jgi:hypothetical protein
MTGERKLVARLSGESGASRGLLLDSKTVECRLRLTRHAPDDLARRQDLVDVADALPGR